MYGLHFKQSGFKVVAIRASIALCFYGPAYLLQIYSLLFAYHARFSPLASRALGNMIGDVLTAILYTVFGLQSFDNQITASIVISIIFGLSSIIYALQLQSYSSKLTFTSQQLELLRKMTEDLELTAANENGTIDFKSNDVEIVTSSMKSKFKIPKQFYSKLLLILLFISGAIVCNIIGFSLKSNLLVASFILQIGAACLRPLYQTLPSSLDLSEQNELIQLVIRSLIALVFAAPEFYDHYSAILKAEVSGSVVVSNAVGSLPGELFTAFLAYQWLGERIDVPIRLTIIAAFVSFITQISIEYSIK